MAQKQKEIELIVECVEYIGDGKYRANFGYNNPNKDKIAVPEDNSVVIYNKGQSKKYAVNSFESGRKYNVFSQEFAVDDRCIWRMVLPNGAEKQTDASSSSSHCRSGLGLDPIFDGQAEGGVIWPELYYLARDYTPGTTTSNEVFQITKNDQVLIEIIVNDVSYLTDPVFLAALSNLEFVTISTTETTLKITGYLPINRVLELNNFETEINFVQSLYTPIPNAGTVLSQGDSAQGSDQVREGWELNGEGLNIGILSDSYNNLGLAAGDVSNGNLPDDVVIVKDYPTQGIFFNQRDEGRAMAQIVHDIVPAADIYFHTAMISSGDFARGIINLVDDYQCKLIGDDITYITEPYFQDGIIAQAVNYAFSQQVYYATAAGNFGGNSYEAISAPISFNRNQFDFLPNDNTLLAHDFGGGVIKQSLSLMPGRYLIKFEWDDPFYTLRQFSGALTNYDVWVVSDDNELLYSGNRDNIGEDPQEYLAFTVPGDQAFPVNFLITAPNMSAGQKLKYTVFVKPVAGFTWNNQSQTGINAGTIVGQANAAGAVTIGAALYTNTPPYGGTPTIASFSSRGGVQVKNQSGIFENRQKPDFVGPNGVNTSVFLGEVYNSDGTIFNIDGDSDPNFYGTSASAPHNLGIAAQIIEGGKSYFNVDWPPAEVKIRMANGTIDMGTAGYDIESGYGYVQANVVLQELANPKPQLHSLSTTQEIIAGEVYTNIDLFADGDYFTEESVILLRGEPIPTEFVSNSQLSATIELSGDPEISVNTPSKEGTIPNSNGGTTEVLRLFDVEKTTITIISDPQEKYYLQEIPDYTVTVNVDPPGEDNSYVSETILSDLGLEISYDAPATRYSNVRSDWKIRPYFTIEPEVGLTELYDFVFPPLDEQGRLNILPLDIKITPNDIPALPYGEIIPEISSQIEVLTPGVTIPDAILAEVLAEYKRNFSPEADYVLSNASRSLANASRSLANASRSLANNSAWIISGTSITNQARSLANQARSLANASRSLANGNNVIDVDAQLIEGYEEFPGGTGLIPNASRSLANAARGLANMAFIASGDANITNAARSLANASRSLANSESFNAESNAEVVLIFDKDNLEGLPEEEYQNEYEPIANIFAIHLITGLATTSDEENDEVSNSCWILPGAYISNGVSVETPDGTDIRYSASNFRFTYGQGLLYIDPAPLTVTADDATKVYGFADPLPEEYTFTISEDFPLVLDDENVFSGTLTRENGEDVTVDENSYAISKGSLDAGDNYVLTVIPGKFTITPAALTITVTSGQSKVYGEGDPLTFESTDIGLVPSDVYTLARAPGENVGNYAISISEFTAGDNYILNFEGADFIITKATLTAIADNQTKVYGQVINQSDLTISYEGWVNGDNAEGNPYTFSVNSPIASTNVDESSPAGFYENAITVSGGEDQNYSFSYDFGDFNVTPAPLTITVTPGQSKIYGEGDPLTFQSTDIGLVPGDVYTLTRAHGDNAGNYAISISEFTAGDNYTLNFEGADFIITKATLTATADNQTKVYGQVVNQSDLTISYEGWVNGDNAEGTPYTFSVSSPITSTSVDESSPVDFYENAITVSGGEDQNYSFLYDFGDFNVTPAPLTITVTPEQSKVYGEDDPLTFESTDIGLVPGDDYTLTRTPGENVGNYAISINEFTAGDNYIIIFNSDDFSITPAPLYITATQIAIFSEGNADLNSVFEFTYDPEETRALFSINGPNVTVSAYNSPSTIPPGDYPLLYNSQLQNYQIANPELGRLFVNPFGPSTPNVHPRLDCIEETGDPEFPFVAHLYYDNPNSTTLFVPIGENNKIYYASGTGSLRVEPEQPTLFYPGSHSFDVYFNGSKTIWDLKSHNTSLSAAVSSDASTGSNRCSDSGARLSSSQSERSTKTDIDIENMSGYPNPASNIFFVNLNEGLMSQGEYKLVDMNGKIHDVHISRNYSRKRLEVDLNRMNSGLYLLKLDFDDDSKIIKVIKQ